MRGKVKWVVMKYLILLKAISSKQAKRNYLKIYERIKLSERGKPGHGNTYLLMKCYREKETITYINPGESGGTVPKKQ